MYDVMSVRPEAVARASSADGRVPALDGLRGIAILLVLMLHFALYGGARPDGLVDRLAYTGMMAGWTGVDLFFVLSGFLITGILYDARGRAHYFRNFYMRRVLRIFPLYYVSLAVFLGVLPLLMPDHPEVARLVPETPWYLLYLTNVRVAVDGWIPSGMLGHFWSLAVEEQFYLFWPLVVLLCGRRTLIYSCVAIVAGSLILRVALHEMGHSTAAYVLTPARFDSLAVGALVAVLARDTGGLGRWTRPAVAVGLSSALGLATMAIAYRGFPAEEYLIGTVGYSLLALLFGALLVLAATARPHTRHGAVLESGVLRHFGRYSYGLYVIHQPVLFLLPAWWSIDAWAPHVGSWLLTYLLFAVSATALCLGLAMLSWHVLEERFLRLKQRFTLDGSSSVRPPNLSQVTTAPLRKA